MSTINIIHNKSFTMLYVLFSSLSFIELLVNNNH